MKSPLVLLGILIASPASATPYIAYAPAPEPPALRRTEIHVGMLAGGSNIGDVGGPGIGVELGLGRRFGDLTLLGQVDYLSVGESMDGGPEAQRGGLVRGGLTARYTLMSLDPDSNPLGVGLWLEGGVGRQRVTWQQGGTLTRNDLSLGLGVQLDNRLGGQDDAPRYFGPYFAVRALLAQGPEPQGSEAAEPPTCGGPCDAPGAPSRNDLSLFFHFGLTWGR